jgi:hypothetical protein
MLPYFQSTDRILSQLQTAWASLINPVITLPQSQGIILPNVSLASGANVVNHMLGRKLQGWQIVRQRASATIYDTQDLNQTPQLTLNLTASGAVVVNLFVF